MNTESHVTATFFFWLVVTMPVLAFSFRMNDLTPASAPVILMLAYIGGASIIYRIALCPDLPKPR